MPGCDGELRAASCMWRGGNDAVRIQLTRPGGADVGQVRQVPLLATHRTRRSAGPHRLW